MSRARNKCLQIASLPVRCSKSNKQLTSDWKADACSRQFIAMMPFLSSKTINGTASKIPEGSEVPIRLQT